MYCMNFMDNFHLPDVVGGTFSVASSCFCGVGALTGVLVVLASAIITGQVSGDIIVV